MVFRSGHTNTELFAFGEHPDVKFRIDLLGSTIGHGVRDAWLEGYGEEHQ